jgi:hypothetical protein
MGVSDEFLRRPWADAAVGRGDLKLGAHRRAVGRGGLRLGFAFAGGATTTAASAAVVDFSGRGRAVTVVGEMLRERHAVLPLGQRAKPRRESVDAGGGRAQAEQEAGARGIAERGVAVGVEKRGAARASLSRFGVLAIGWPPRWPIQSFWSSMAMKRTLGFFAAAAQSAEGDAKPTQTSAAQRRWREFIRGKGTKTGGEAG